ncbi:hypothetical protein FIBSPDRAFT_868486, partial [Athelia psychrophila]
EGEGSGSELQVISDKTLASYRKLAEYASPFAVGSMTELSIAVQLGATRLRVES